MTIPSPPPGTGGKRIDKPMATNRIVAAAPVVERLRLTIPARKVLEAAGNVVAERIYVEAPWPLFDVTLDRPPPAGSLVMVSVRFGGFDSIALRRPDEDPFPGEWPDDDGVDMWTRATVLVGCPRCGRALVWYEAGYVPGYRICTVGHAAQLSRDCRSAKDVGRTIDPTEL